MDKPALSSNWKKLQATLKKDTKSKPAERTTDDKKRKLTDKTKSYRDSKPLKRKRMSDTDDSTPSTRRKSSAASDPVPPKETSSRYKENEGRSKT